MGLEVDIPPWHHPGILFCTFQGQGYTQPPAKPCSHTLSLATRGLYLTVRFLGSWCWLMGVCRGWRLPLSGTVSLLLSLRSAISFRQLYRSHGAKKHAQCP